VRRIFLHALLGGLAWLPGLGEATVLRAPVELIEYPRIHLPRAQRLEVESTACREFPAQRREILVAWRVPDDRSLLVFVRCHGERSDAGDIWVEDMRCTKEVAAAWQCRHHTTGFRVDVGRHYILASNGPMIIDIPGEPPENSNDAMAAILASEPRRLHGKTCYPPAYRLRDAVFEIECEYVRYLVKRTCDEKGCRRTVRRE